MSDNNGTVLFIPHGGGPLPLLGHEPHQKLVSFLKEVPNKFPMPDAILVISAHWEEDVATVTSSQNPDLLYDYYGFPAESYSIKYPAPGNPELANKITNLLKASDIPCKQDSERGLDHGVFVPLTLMYPDADIPCVQLSLVKDLDPQQHINIGKALSELRKENVLILGSGFSFHNLKVMLSPNAPAIDKQNVAFEAWLSETCTDKNLSEKERENSFKHWSDAPHARYCHPREEHLIPLHVCYGCAETRAKLVFDDEVMGKKASGYLW